MHLNKSYYWLAVMVLAAACNSTQKEEVLGTGEYLITVKVENPVTDAVALLSQMKGQGQEVLDTATWNAQDSTFVFRDSAGLDDFAVIQIGTVQQLLVYLEPGRMSIAADGNQPSATHTILSGGKHNLYLQALNRYQEQYKLRMDEFQQEYVITQPQIGDEEMRILQGKFEALQKEETEKLKSLIRSMDSTVVAIYATGLFYNKDEVFSFMDSLSTRLSVQLPTHKYAQLFAEEIAKLRKFAIGQPAPEFSLTDMQGKPFALSKLRGNIVLIDFWASWCKPCRMENPNMVATYKKYRNKPFKIVGVSLDRAEASWREAIRADGLNWQHVWDQGGAVATNYAVSSIPATFLLDKDGKILAKNLRGDALEAKLKEVL